MNSITASMGKKGPTWSREFDSLIRAIGECKSKAEEDALISKEVEILKPRLKDPKMDKRWLKELLVRLIYVEMLGQDASWAHVKALQACSETNLITKKVAYLASSLFLDYKDDTIILVVNTLSTDLKSDNYLVVCSALTAICKLISPDLINAVLPRTLELLTHPKELVRKKAVMALDRYLQLDPERDGPLAGVDLDRHLRQALCDKDPSVMSAALCALQEAIQRDPKPYKNLIPSFVSILKQVAEHRLPKAFDYHRTPAPFLQIKLLRILGQLGVSDKQASDNMYAVVADSMRRGNTGHTIGNAIVYEAVRTIANIYPNPILLQSAAEMISTFLKSSSHNLKYVGIDGLARIVRINPKYAAEHQLAVIDCLEDPDDMLKKKTLELLYKMTKPNNVEVIVDKMVDYLRTTNDEVTKTEVVKRIGELAERFAPDTQWFLDTMNQVFELGGEVVSPQLANSLMRLIAEGAGEEDDQADTELRAQAVASYLDLLDKPKLSAVLLKVICWVLGEYGTLADVPVDSVIDKLAGILDTQNVTDSVRGFLITALGKLCSQAQCNLSPQAHQLLHDAANSRNLDLQQHALEIQGLLGGAVQTRQAALPPDASCEDLQIDVSLPFLNSFVQQAVEQGAAPYISQQQRTSMGVMPTSRHHEPADQPHALRFAAYEKAQAPGAAQPQHNLLDGSHQQAVSQQSSSRSSSPVKGIHGDAGPAPAAQSAATPSTGGGEPQLTLRGAGGARRWGPAHFEAAPAAVTAASTSARQPAAAAHATPAASTAAAESHRPVSSAAEPHVPTQKELLAASLFGDSSSRPARQRRHPAHHAVPAAHHAASTQPAPVATSAAAQPAAADLLLALDSPGPTASAAPAVSSDPFAALEVVAPPAAAAPAATPNLVDLDDLYDAPAPVQPPFSQTSPLGFMPTQNHQAPAHAAQMLQPVSAMPAAVLQAKAPVPQHQKPAPVAGGPAPMAPRGNAAVEQQAGRKDPFADLFS